MKSQQLKPKHNKMPVDYTVMTTQELIDIITDPAKAQQKAAAIAELIHDQRRIIEETSEFKGGISPVRRP